MSSRKARVREPIQVYLTRGERAALDRLARTGGVSRAEVLRRGLELLARHEGNAFHDAMDALVGVLSGPRVPRDLAERHDEHLARDVTTRMARFRRRSS